MSLTHSLYLHWSVFYVYPAEPIISIFCFRTLIFTLCDDIVPVLESPCSVPYLHRVQGVVEVVAIQFIFQEDVLGFVSSSWESKGCSCPKANRNGVDWVLVLKLVRYAHRAL